MNGPAECRGSRDWVTSTRSSTNHRADLGRGRGMGLEPHQSLRTAVEGGVASCSGSGGGGSGVPGGDRVSWAGHGRFWSTGGPRGRGDTGRGPRLGHTEGPLEAVPLGRGCLGAPIPAGRTPGVLRVVRGVQWGPGLGGSGVFHKGCCGPSWWALCVCVTPPRVGNPPRLSPCSHRRTRLPVRGHPSASEGTPGSCRG